MKRKFDWRLLKEIQILIKEYVNKQDAIHDEINALFNC